jgi:predicted glutamine amidotransferase
MCGIVGYMSTDKTMTVAEKQHFMRWALTIDTLRGRDSTGLIMVSNKFNVKAARTTMAGNVFVTSKGYRTLDVGNEKRWCVIGHNRAATVGGATLANAHPFKFGDITLVHNGTLNKGGERMPTYQKEFDVDSMQVAYALSLSPPEDAHKVLATVDGSFCLVWTDARDNSVNFARNSNRPMHIIQNYQKDSMYFMSDGSHLAMVMKSLGNAKSKGHTIYQIDTHKHLKFKKGNLTPEVTKFDPFVAPVSTTTGQKGGGYHMTANQRASHRWSSLRSRARGIKAVIPFAMKKVMKDWFDVDPDTRLKFEPVQEWEHDGKKCTIEGEVSMPHWGDVMYPAIIHNAPTAEVRAYWDEKEWYVRPIGLGRPTSGCGDASILCEVVSWICPTAEVGAAPPSQQPLVPVESKVNEIRMPNGTTISAGAAQKVLDKGCAYCGGNLLLEQMPMYVECNNGQDVLCETCSFNEKVGDL